MYYRIPKIQKMDLKKILKLFISEYRKNPKEGWWCIKALMIAIIAACLVLGSLFLKKMLGININGIKSP
jgi:hypothetical protein